MERRISAGAFAASFGLATGCFVPERDNPHDPRKAPRFEIRIFDDGDLTQITSASPGTNLLLRAVPLDPTTDPSRFTYEWDLDDDLDGDPSVDPLEFEVTTGNDPEVNQVNGAPLRLVLPASALVNGVGNAIRTPRVRITSVESGHVAVIASAIGISNAAPIADLGPDLFVPPGDVSPVTVVLDACGGRFLCTSTDPDGDGLTWTWSQLARGPQVALTPLDAASTRMSFSAPAGRHNLVFRATASDGTAGATDEIRVIVGSQIWAVTDQKVLRIYPDFRVTDPPAGQAYGAAIAVDSGSGEIWLAWTTTASTVEVTRRSRDLEVLETVPVGTGFGTARSLVVATGGGYACASIVENSTFTRFATIAPGQPPTLHPASAMPEIAGRVVSDGAGCYALTSTSVYALTAAAGLSTPLLGSQVGGIFEDAAVEPDGTLWVTERFGGISFLHRRDPGGAFAVPYDLLFRADALAPHPGGGVIAHDATTLGFWWIDWTGTDYRLTYLYPAPVVELETSTISSSRIAVDPVEGALLAADVNRGLLRMRLDGDALREEGLLAPTLDGAPSFSDTALEVAVDPATGDAAALFQNGGSLKLARVPPHMRRKALVPVALPQPRSLSVARGVGHAWLGEGTFSGSGAGVRRVTPEGDHVAINLFDVVLDVEAEDDGGVWVTHASSLNDAGGGSLSHLRGDGTLDFDTGIAGVTWTRMARNGNTLCLASQNGSISSGTDGVAGRMDAQGYTPSSTTVGSTSDVGAHSDGSCWFADCFGQQLVHLPAASASATVFTAPGGVDLGCPASLAVDPRDGSAWIFDNVLSRILRVSPTGAVLSDWSVTPNSFPAIAVEPLCASPTDDACLRVWWSSTTGADSQLRSSPAGASPVEAAPIPLPGGTVYALDVLP